MMQKVFFRNSRGLNLAGILHTPENHSKKAVITAHGFTSNKSGSFEKFPRMAEELLKLDIATLRFDFSGCGESDPDTIMVARQVDDLKAAIAFMRGKGYTEIALLGSSLGGLVSVLAYEKGIKTMVLWAPVTDAKIPSICSEREIVAQFREKGFAIIRNRKGTEHRVAREYLAERKSINQKEILSKIRCPVLIVHGNKDEMVPIGHSREAVNYLPKGSKLEVIKGADHFFTGKVDKVIEISGKWLERLL